VDRLRSPGYRELPCAVWRLVNQWIPAITADSGSRIPDPGSLTPAEKAIRRKTHDTIRRVTVDIEQRQQLQHGGLRHDGTRQRSVYVRRARWCTSAVVVVVGEAIEALVRMLSPFAPHTARKLWRCSVIKTA